MFVTSSIRFSKQATKKLSRTPIANQFEKSSFWSLFWLKLLTVHIPPCCLSVDNSSDTVKNIFPPLTVINYMDKIKSEMNGPSCTSNWSIFFTDLKNINFVTNRSSNRKFWYKIVKSGQIGHFQGRLQRMVKWRIILQHFHCWLLWEHS